MTTSPSPRRSKIIKSLGNNYLFAGAATLLMPAGILRWLYDANQGQSWNGKPSCLTLSFDCDYPEDVTAIPSLLEILRPYPFRASFACVGYWIEKYPEVHGRILEDGHEIINHTYSHPDNEILNPGRKFRECTLSEKTEEVERCHTVCERILGYSPSGFRIPHFKHNFGPEIYGILQKLGYRISSSTWLTNTLTGGLPFRFGDIVEFPLATCPCHPFTVFDSWHSLHSRRWIHRIGHRGEKGFVDAFRRLLVIGKTRNAYLNVYIDPLDVPRISGFRGLLEEIARGDFEVVTYGQFLERFPSRVVVDKMK